MITWLRTLFSAADVWEQDDKTVVDRIKIRVSDANTRFNKCVRIVLKHEGGYVDHPRDPGGATNHGISLRYARTRGSMFDLDGDGDVDKHDILLVNKDFAAQVYRDWFWADVRGDEQQAGIDLSLFDCAVNSGAGRAVRFAQGLLGLEVDGYYGPKTHAALLDITDAAAFCDAYNARRLAWLQTLGTWGNFGRGWTNRVRDVSMNAKMMTLPPTR